MTVPVLDALTRDLAGADTTTLLRVAWDALTLAADAADALAWADGVDTVVALGTVTAATAGRAVLPLPQGGHPPTLPQPVDAAVAGELADVLDLLQQHLELAGATAEEPADVHTLHACADQVRATARGLRNLRETA
jgi:hypothetical protein